MIYYFLRVLIVGSILTSLFPDSSTLGDDLPPAAFSINPFFPPADVRAAAEQGKQAFVRLARNDKVAQELGFVSAAEAAGKKDLLTPFPIFRVQVYRLPDFAPRQGAFPDPESIVVFGREFIYPVAVSTEVRSSIIVTHFQSSYPEWRATEWGARGLIRNLVDVAAMSGANAPFALAIPEMSRYFLGTFSDRFLIVPLYSEPKLGLKRGVGVPAEIVFSKIVAELPK